MRLNYSDDKNDEMRLNYSDDKTDEMRLNYSDDKTDEMRLNYSDDKTDEIRLNYSDDKTDEMRLNYSDDKTDEMRLNYSDDKTYEMRLNYSDDKTDEIRLEYSDEKIHKIRLNYAVEKPIEMMDYAVEKPHEIMDYAAEKPIEMMDCAVEKPNEIIDYAVETPYEISYHELLATINVLDLVLTLILPVLLVAGLMLFTLVAVVQAVKRKNRLHDSLIGNHRSHNERFQTVEVKVAKFLTIVSLTLLVLHSPSHVIRLKLLVASTARSTHVSDVDPTLQRAFEVMYYLNFSANFCIYATAGENFRRTFLRIFSFCHVCTVYRSRRMKRLSPEASPHQSDSSMHMELTVVNDAFEDTSIVEDDFSIGGSKACPRECSSEHYIYAKEYSVNGAPPNVALL